MTAILALIALSLPPTLAPAPPVVCVVTDAASWRAAVRLSWTRDVSIQLSATLPYTGEPWDYRLGRAGGVVEIVGGVVDFAAHVPAVPTAENGLQFTGDRATLRGVTVRGFNGHGSAVRFDVDGTIEVLDCTFADIGTRVLTLPGGVAWYTNVLGAFNLQADRIVVLGNTFNRCALNDEQLAHVLYVQASQSILCSGNRYYGCGSVWGCYSPRTVIVGELADFGQTPDVYNRQTQQMQHAWAIVHNGGNLTFCGNMIRGTLDHVFHGRTPRGVVAGNTYDCTARYWAFEWGIGEISREAFAAKVEVQ